MAASNEASTKAWANRLHSNIMLGICALLFIILGVQQLVRRCVRCSADPARAGRFGRTRPPRRGSWIIVFTGGGR